jgi:putative IMPACT (imprinted ancient) family translation regulator
VPKSFEKSLKNLGLMPQFSKRTKNILKNFQKLGAQAPILKVCPKILKIFQNFKILKKIKNIVISSQVLFHNGSLLH